MRFYSKPMGLHGGISLIYKEITLLDLSKNYSRYPKEVASIFTLGIP